MDRFYIGLHHPSDAWAFPRCCLSVNTLRTRRKPLGCPDVLLDSGAFTEVSRHGHFRTSVEEYARRVWEMETQGTLTPTAVVSQDFMCEPFILGKTGLTVHEHQELTVSRYRELLVHLQWLYDGAPPFHVMPVLQGYSPEEYLRCLDLFGDGLASGCWVGVGSVCKRNSSPWDVVRVLEPVKRERPDLLLHGFGIKLTALRLPEVRALLHTSDSQAWSYLARRNDSYTGDVSWAQAYAEGIEELLKADTRNA